MKKFSQFIVECEQLNEFLDSRQGAGFVGGALDTAVKAANSIKKFSRTVPAQQFLKNIKPSALKQSLAPGVKGFRPGSPGTMIASVLGSFGADQLGSYLGKKLAKGVISATGNQQLYPSMFGKQGPTLGTDLVRNIKRREALKPKVDPVVKPRVKPAPPGDIPSPAPEEDPSRQPERETTPEKKPSPIGSPITTPGVAAAAAAAATASRTSPQTQTQPQPQKSNNNNNNRNNNKRNKPKKRGGGGKLPRFKLPGIPKLSASINPKGYSDSKVSGIKPYISQI